MRHKVGKWGKREVLKVYRSFIGIRLSNIPVDFWNGFRMHLATLISLCWYLTTANKRKPSPFLPPIPANSVVSKYTSDEVQKYDFFVAGKYIYLFLQVSVPLNLQADQTETWVLSSPRLPRSSAHHAPPFLLLKGKVIQVSFTSSILKTFSKSFSDIVIFIFQHRRQELSYDGGLQLLLDGRRLRDQEGPQVRPRHLWGEVFASHWPPFFKSVSLSEVCRQVHHPDLHGQ